MNIPVAVFAVIKRFETPLAESRIFSGRTGEAHAIVLVGAIAAAIGIGCLIYGLRAEWREWTKTHVYHWRKRD
ncbi:MAG TPA: hypothetical protein VL742_03480 [Casimicrobiaceae bacterium]|nr:hypothetical protein [Casimicrobiaceae bacterium]